MRRQKTVELILEDIYSRFHKKELIKPDPIQFLGSYNDMEDREIAGLVCACLALGRVNSIITIITKVLAQLPSPRKNLEEWDRGVLEKRFDWFVYRFFKKEDLVDLLLSIGRVIRKYGSLNGCFLAGMTPSDKNVLPGLTCLVENLNGEIRLKMVPDPAKGSAVKRLMLYLRWMVRKDEIDPGGWTGVSPSRLIIPLDTHMLKVAKLLKLTERKDGGMKTALEITETLRKYDHSDPVRFDFSLTRPGIHPDLNYGEFNL